MVARISEEKRDINCGLSQTASSNVYVRVQASRDTVVGMRWTSRNGRTRSRMRTRFVVLVVWVKNNSDKRPTNWVLHTLTKIMQISDKLMHHRISARHCTHTNATNAQICESNANPIRKRTDDLDSHHPSCAINAILKSSKWDFMRIVKTRNALP
jgi:hypothetical protein